MQTADLARYKNGTPQLILNIDPSLFYRYTSFQPDNHRSSLLKYQPYHRMELPSSRSTTAPAMSRGTASNSCQLSMPGLAELDVNTMCFAALGPIQAESFAYSKADAELTINWPEGQRVYTYTNVGDFLQANGTANGADIIANAYALEAGWGSAHHAVFQHPDSSVSVIEGGMGDRQDTNCLTIYDARGNSVNVRGGHPWTTGGEGRVWKVDAQALIPPFRYVPVAYTQAERSR
jgi:hypothetical protein